MRLIYKAFDDGSYTVYKTDDEGQKKKTLEGDAKFPTTLIGNQTVFIEVSCDDRRPAIAKARSALSSLARYLTNRNGKAKTAK